MSCGMFDSLLQLLVCAEFTLRSFKVQPIPHLWGETVLLINLLASNSHECPDNRHGSGIVCFEVVEA